MEEFFVKYASEIWSAIAGLFAGGSLGSLITFKIVRSQQASGSGRNIDQSRSRAGGDIVGGDKTIAYGDKPSDSARG